MLVSFLTIGSFGRIMEREKQLSILYQKQGRATQFPSKAARDKWLQKEIDDLERVLSSNLAQVCPLLKLFCVPHVISGCCSCHLYAYMVLYVLLNYDQ